MNPIAISCGLTALITIASALLPPQAQAQEFYGGYNRARGLNPRGSGLPQMVPPPGGVLADPPTTPRSGPAAHAVADGHGPVVLPVALEARVGKVSHELNQLDTNLKEQIQNLQSSLKAALNAHERAPQLESAAESERIRLFRDLLRNVVHLGEVSLSEETKFRKIFMQWEKSSDDGAKVFREAEGFFKSKAEEASVTQVAQFYRQAARWYGSRAARHEARGEVAKIPTTFDTELGRVREMVQAARLLLSFVEKDPYLLEDNEDIELSVGAFFKSFEGVSALLDAWSDELMKNLEPVDELDSAPAAPASDAADDASRTRQATVVQTSGVEPTRHRQERASGRSPIPASPPAGQTFYRAVVDPRP